MHTFVPRSIIINQETFGNVIDDIFSQGKRVFENFSAPSRVERKEEGVSVFVNLAGFEKEDISVLLDETENVLKISAGEKEVKDNDSENENFKQSTLGFYNRKAKLVFTLPENIDYESINSDYSNGVLKVSFGIKAATKRESRNIPVS